jgi:hypothetical protein
MLKDLARRLEAGNATNPMALLHDRVSRYHRDWQSEDDDSIEVGWRS